MSDSFVWAARDTVKCFTSLQNKAFSLHSAQLFTRDETVPQKMLGDLSEFKYAAEEESVVML